MKAVLKEYADEKIQRIRRLRYSLFLLTPTAPELMGLDMMANQWQQFIQYLDELPPEALAELETLDLQKL